jgi:WD repeat-containing protein 45
MNTRQLINESSGPISLSASYNQDCSCFAVGLDTGFCGRLITCSLVYLILISLVFNTETCELETARGKAFL